ncbi:hypothetical protein LXL04_024004 [Taraxacum kok-saghyz]
MRTTDPVAMNKPPDRPEIDRGNHFPFCDLVKSDTMIHGNAIPTAILLDNSPFEINPDKPMEMDTGVDPNPNEQEIYRSILYLNPNYSISAPVAEFNKDINLFCQWGDSEQLHDYWNGLNYAQNEKLLLGLKFKLIPGPNFDKKAEIAVKNMKSVHHPKKRNKMFANWLKLELKQKVRLVNKMGSSKIHMALLKSIKKRTRLPRKFKEEKINDEVEGSGKDEVKVPMSYADKVGRKTTVKNLISMINKDPKLPVGDVEMPFEDILKGSEPFSTTLYGYFIEKSVNFFNVNKYTMSKWKNFGIEEGLKEVLEGGPWIFFDNPIVIRRWVPGLRLSKDQLDTIPVWVKVYNVPLEYWNATGLSHIGWEIGKPHEMSASKVWLKEINIYSRDVTTRDRIQSKCKIEYAWNPSKCSHCKVYGHKDSNCGILIAMDAKMKETKGNAQVDQELRNINIIDEMIKKNVPVNLDADGYQKVTRKTNNKQKKRQGQYGNFNRNNNNKETVHNSNVNSINAQFGANSKPKKVKTVEGTEVGITKMMEEQQRRVQIYVPKTIQNPIVSSNFVDGIQAKKKLFHDDLVSKNKFEILENVVEMEEEALFEIVDIEEDYTLDEDEGDSVENVEEMEEIQGDEADITKNMAFSQ